MSECLAKQEQLVTFMLHVKAFLYVGFRMYHLHMHRYKGLHTCKKVFLRGRTPISCFHQTTATKCQSSLAINTKASNTRQCLREKESWVDEWGYWPRTCCLQWPAFHAHLTSQERLLTTGVRAFSSEGEGILEKGPSCIQNKCSSQMPGACSLFQVSTGVTHTEVVYPFSLVWQWCHGFLLRNYM